MGGSQRRRIARTIRTLHLAAAAGCPPTERPALAQPPSRLQIAQRIHQVLLREIGHAIEVERLVTEPRYARDVLLVCDALPGTEAAPLATMFRQLPPPATGEAAPAGPPGHARQSNEWARDTSGFGVTHPPPVEPPAGGDPRSDGGSDKAGGPERRRNWLPRWRDPG